MAGVEWVRWVFAAMFATLTLFYVARLCTPRRDAAAWAATAHRDVDASRGVMSLGMVAMLMPWADPLPRLFWQVVFGVAAGHIAVRLIRRHMRSVPVPPPHLGGHHEMHLVVGGLAMVYMLAVMPAGRAMEGMEMAATGSAGVALPALTWAFIAYFLVFVVRLGARLAIPTNMATETPATAVLGSGTRGVVISPHLLGSSELVMAIGMSYMLMTML
ncbi:MAG: DUF5134 domain-containing protein [Pseudonocardiaceae bacterium]